MSEAPLVITIYADVRQAKASMLLMLMTLHNDFLGHHHGTDRLRGFLSKKNAAIKSAASEAEQ